MLPFLSNQTFKNKIEAKKSNQRSFEEVLSLLSRQLCIKLIKSPLLIFT